MATDIARCLKKNICCLINNRTKEFCQNLKISLKLVQKHLDLDFEAKIGEIH